MVNPKDLLFSIYEAGVKASSSETLLKRSSIPFISPVLLLGAGKVSLEMANAFAKINGLSEAKGCIIVPEIDEYTQQSNGKKKRKAKFDGAIVEGSHPLPSQKSIEATWELLNFLKKEGGQEEVVFFLSGGASALFELPVPEISLGDLRETTRILLSEGASIEEINTVRKHLSQVKGGRLASLLGDRRCTTVVLSDVEGDRLDLIGSAPTHPDSSTFQDALSVLKRLKVESKIPPAVFAYLRDGARKIHPETLKPESPVFKNHRWLVVGNAWSAVMGAKKKAESMGLPVVVEQNYVKGDGRVLGWLLAQRGKKTRSPMLMIAAGEPTVRVMGKGKGGRCQEVALSFLIEAKGSKEVYLLAAGTDGRDGPTEAAGAFASHESFQKGVQQGLDPESFLADSNSYPFFKALGDTVETGLTGTNVNDLFLLWVPG